MAKMFDPEIFDPAIFDTSDVSADATNSEWYYYYNSTKKRLKLK